MKVRTTSTVLPVPQAQAYAYLSDEGNLPLWAVNFCSSIEKADGHYYAETPQGRLLVDYAKNPLTGVIDIGVGPDAEHIFRWPMRVTPLHDGRSLFLFTAIQASGTTDEVFEAQCAGLVEEFEVLKANLLAEVVT